MKTSRINGAKMVRFSQGDGSNFGKVRDKTETLDDFYSLFHDAMNTGETFRQFNKMSDLQQRDKKAMRGFWFRAHTGGKRRNRSSALPSDFITLDFDYVTVEFFKAVYKNTLGIPFEYAVHTSRRHTPDDPRFRVIIPVSVGVDNDAYPAVSRILASQFDPTMKLPDPVSFRSAQMMFLPTRCSDGKYHFVVHEGELADPNEVLDTFEMTVGDWRDITLLPKAPDEKLRQTAEKAEDPTEKVGPVGNFCRAYSVEDAIDKFLPDVYAPVDLPSAKPRYSYLGGTTVNGAEVQDDGLFLYSHHGSDPCSDMLVNAFDLVRIHKFADEDKGFDAEGKKANEYPSYKAMVEFIKDDDAYRKQVVASNYDTNEMFDDLWDEDEIEIEDDEIDSMVGTVPEPVDRDEDDEDDEDDPSELVGDVPAKELGRAILKPLKPKKRPKPEEGWVATLEADRAGKVIPNIANITRILTCDPRFRDSIAFNEFHARAVCRVPLRTKLDWITPPPIADKENGDPWQDYHENNVRVVLESEAGTGKKGWGMKVSDRDLTGAVDLAARMNSFHPVRDRLESFDWDKNTRLDRLFIDYLGCPDTPYYREAARKFLIAAVARVYEPGHKFDYVPTLWGAQGKRKSTFINVLALGWAGELKANFSDEKAMVEQMMGCLIMELPELSAVGRSAVEDMKAFISGTETNVRLAYRRNAQVFKRQCVFMGSTNNKDFLRDQTGNRRFWPIEVVVDSIETDRLARAMPQIWAEAVAAYRAMRAVQPHGMLPLHLTSFEAQQEAEELQAGSLRENDADMVAAILADKLNSKVRVGDDFDEAQGGATYEWPKRVFAHKIATEWLDGVKVTGQMSQVVAEALNKLGWVKSGARERVTINGERTKNPVRSYVPGPDQIAVWEQLDEAEKSNVVEFRK
jgi:hypothetical protein